MIRILGALLVAAGMTLAFYGMRASESMSSDVSRLFTDSPTDKSIWLMAGGFAVFAAGLVALFRGMQKR